MALLAKGVDVAVASSARIGADSAAQQADARRLMAEASLGIGDGSRAAADAARARQLAPLDPRSHRTLADVYLATHQDDSAAVALMVGSMLTADTTFRANLIDLYRESGAADCAVVATANGVTINPGCPLVHAHVCAASSESITINERIGRQAQADALRASAGQLHCPNR